MGRRTVLLIVAALIAVMGSSMVFLYVKSADDRARDKQDPVEILTAVTPINPGETLSEAQAAGKLALAPIPRELVLPGALTSVGEFGNLVALTPVYATEQIVSAKFGSAGDQEILTIPDGMIAISVSLSDTGRVAGFVSPGSEVAVFLTGSDAGGGVAGTRLLLPTVSVIAVATDTIAPAATAEGGTAAAAEQLPRTLFTLAVTQAQAQKLIYASSNGELAFGLLTDASQVRQGPPTTGVNLFR
jgi:pilus assembly protein CpaB